MRMAEGGNAVLKDVRVADIYRLLNDMAPFETAEAYDNVGLLVGDAKSRVTGVLIALDVTPAAIQTAHEQGINLIVAHHPLMFAPIRRITADTYEGRVLQALIHRHISLIAAHTNMDRTMYSGTAAMAKLLGLRNLRFAGDYVLLGDFAKPKSAGEVQTLLSETLGFRVNDLGAGCGVISTLGLAGGACSDGFMAALQAGAQGYVTGEIKHHHTLEAKAAGMHYYLAGHENTEAPMLLPLAQGLQKQCDDLQWNVRVQAFVHDCLMSPQKEERE